MGRRLWVVGCAVALSAWGTTVAFGQERFRYEPFDEAASVAPLLAVRSALIDAILRHDVPAVGRLLAPDYNADEGGPEAALKAFRESPDLLKELVTSLAFGGGFVDAEKTRFCAPYWYVRSPAALPYPHSLQPEEGYPFMVMLPNVPVFERASRRSKAIGHVGLELVRPALRAAPPRPSNVSGDSDTEGLAAIMFQGKVAYMDGAVLKNPDERVAYGCFERRDGNWLLTAFGYH